MEERLGGAQRALDGREGGIAADGVVLKLARHDGEARHRLGIGAHGLKEGIGVAEAELHADAAEEKSLAGGAGLLGGLFHAGRDAGGCARVVRRNARSQQLGAGRGTPAEDFARKLLLVDVGAEPDTYGSLRRQLADVAVAASRW